MSGRFARLYVVKSTGGHYYYTGRVGSQWALRQARALVFARRHDAYEVAASLAQSGAKVVALKVRP